MGGLKRWIIVAALASIGGPAWGQARRSGLEIYIFEVGQADSMLLVGPAPDRKTLLVDLGVSRYRPFAGQVTARHVARRIYEITGKNRVDYFLLTHFHRDHFGSDTSGVTTLIDTLGVKIGKVIDTGDIGQRFVNRSGDATNYIGRMPAWITAGKVGSRVTPTFGTGSIDLGGGVEVDILAFGGRFAASGPSAHEAYERIHPGHYTRKPTSENDLSIAMEVSLGNFEFWTGGDLSGDDGDGTDPLSGSSKNYTNVEFPMVAYWTRTGRESDVEIYRANHHGSGYSTSPQLLAALDPEHVIYSAHREHKHPSRSTVTNVKATARQYATGLDRDEWGAGADFLGMNGRVVGEVQIFVSPTGSSYRINGEQFRSFSDADERANRDAGP
jgi:beta-lactamase superfamily II metal-dependent hydrolase